MVTITLQQQTTLTTTFSPQLQHAVRLLQMSTLDYARTLYDAVAANPFLELDEAGAEPAASAPVVPEPIAPLGADGRSEATFSQQPHGEAFDLLQQATVPQSLRTYLHDQLGVLRLSPQDKALAGAVVESLDADGYLRISLEEIGATDEATAADSLSGNAEDTLAALHIALSRVQALDPPGVAARTVQECLLLQLPTIANFELREIARRILTDHIDLLASRNFQRMARATGSPVSLIQDAVERIRKLNPRPGWQHEDAAPAFITPDVTVRRIEGVWTTTPNRAALPRIQLHEPCVALYEKHQSEDRQGSGNAELTRCLEQARWTVQNLAQRVSTILEIARAIVVRQRLFLEYGALAMKPMGLREIADAVGVHPSTVSRAAHNKYMATPWGTFEFGYFFSRGFEKEVGGNSAPTAVKELIRQIVAAESPAAPLSDVQLTEELARQGSRIGRRTVTKYRHALKIEPAERRRVPPAGL